MNWMLIPPIPGDLSLQDAAQWIKISISSTQSKISVKAVSGGEAYAGTYAITAKGFLPDGSTTEFTFDIDIGCDDVTINIPTTDSVKTATLGDASQ